MRGLDHQEDMSGPTEPSHLQRGTASKTSLQPLQGMLLTTLISHGSRASLICCSQKYRIKDRGVPHCATEPFPTVPTQPAPVFRHHVRGSGCPTRRKRRLDPCNVAWQMARHSDAQDQSLLGFSVHEMASRLVWIRVSGRHRRRLNPVQVRVENWSGSSFCP